MMPVQRCDVECVSSGAMGRNGEAEPLANGHHCDPSVCVVVTVVACECASTPRFIHPSIYAYRVSPVRCFGVAVWVCCRCCAA